MPAHRRPVGFFVASLVRAACVTVVLSARQPHAARPLSALEAEDVTGGLAEDFVGGQLGIQVSHDPFDFSVAGGTPLASFNICVDAEVAILAASLRGSADLMVGIDANSRMLEIRSTDSSASRRADMLPVAWISFNNTYLQTGWAYLSVRATSDPRISNDLKMYASGLLEGAVSAKQIKDFKHNTEGLMAKDERRYHGLGNFHNLFDRNLHELCSRSDLVPGAHLLDDTAPADPWWKHARYALLQTWGVLDGFNRRISMIDGKPMSMVEMITLNSDGETPELERAYSMSESRLRESRRESGSESVSDMTASISTSALLQAAGGSRRVSHTSHYHAPHHRRSEGIRSQNARDRAQQMQRLDAREWRRIMRATGHCSALVRLTAGNRDLMVGHSTFSDYGEMNRIFKYYDVPLGADSVRRMGFSSYPGVVGSTDDYYLLDSGLVVTETTIVMPTAEPYDKLTDDATLLPDYLRIMVASRLAKTAQEWANLMERSATGTYSSQWMVVDYKRFQPGQRLQKGTLVVVEQAPGLSHTEDMSDHLQRTGFWYSVNYASFKDVRDTTRETEAQEKHGDRYSADRNPRALIFEGTAPNVQSLADMRGEMRRNKWPNEIHAGSGNTPDDAIAARGDLVQSEPEPSGAVDAKVTNRCLAKKLQCNAISGPTADTQNAFHWTDASGHELYQMPHEGQPNDWNFDWVRMSPSGETLQDIDVCAD